MPLLPSHTLLQSYSLTLAITSYFLLTTPHTILNANPLWLLGEAMHIRPATFSPSDHTTNPTTHTLGATLSRSSKLGSLTTSNPSLLLAPSTRELLSFFALILLIASATQAILSTPLRYSKSDLTRLAQKSVSSSFSSTPSHQSSNKYRATPTEKEIDDSRSAFAEKLFNLHSTQTLFLTLSGVRVLGEGALIAYIYLVHSTRTDSTYLGSSILPKSLDNVGTIGMLANRIVFSVLMGDMLFWGYLWTTLREEAREVAGLVGMRRGLVEEAEEEKMNMGR